jgi:hypothetical protein
VAAQYEIYKTIQTNTTKRTAEIVTLFQGKSVTRHLKGGIGRHPDDTIPALHARLEDRVAQNKLAQQHKAEMLSKLGKLSVGDSKGFEKAMREMGIEFATGLKPKEFAELLAKLQAEIDALKANLPFAESALDTVRKEDPLMVRYF